MSESNKPTGKNIKMVYINSPKFKNIGLKKSIETNN